MSDKVSDERLREYAASFNNPDVRALAAELLALRAQQQAAGWSVKPLEWRPAAGEMGANGWRFVAEAAVGRNYVVQVIVHGQLGERWEVVLLPGNYATLDEAKAAAQSDYVARINSAIEPAPVAGEREQVIAAMSVELERHQAFADDAVQSIVWATRLYAAMLAARPISASGRDGE